MDPQGHPSPAQPSLPFQKQSSNYSDWKCTHETPLLIGTGKLFGLNGIQHSKTTHQYDLNIFLESNRFPQETPLTCGIDVPTRLGLPKLIGFPLTDGHPPDEGPILDWLINTILEELLSGGSVAISCFGGHGRTGTFLATIWGLTHPDDPHPIESVRAIVCPNEVETYLQEKFIHSYLGLPILEQPKWIPSHSAPTTDWSWNGSYYFDDKIDWNNPPMIFDLKDRPVLREPSRPSPYIRIQSYDIPVYIDDQLKVWPEFICDECQSDMVEAIGDPTLIECCSCKTKTLRDSIEAANFNDEEVINHEVPKETSGD